MIWRGASRSFRRRAPSYSWSPGQWRWMGRTARPPGGKLARREEGGVFLCSRDGEQPCACIGDGDDLKEGQALCLRTWTILDGRWRCRCGSASTSCGIYIVSVSCGALCSDAELPDVLEMGGR